MSVRESINGEPEAINLGGDWQSVQLAKRPWRIDQHWWRGNEVSRMYYRVLPEDGPPITVFKDLASGEWFRQEY